MKKIILILLFVAGVTAFAKAQDTTRVKRTPEERAQRTLTMMQKRLNLTADQSKQISVILADRADKAAKMQGVKGNNLARLQAANDADKKIDAILTDDQRKTYAQIKETAKEKMKDRRKANAAEPTATPATPAQ
jgi:protein CpxP